MSETDLLRIHNVDVHKLFGLYNHSISLNLDERVTIIHGPNGVGKTMILKLLTSIFSGKFNIFFRIPFEKFEIQFNNGEAISIDSLKISQGKKKPERSLRVSWIDENKKTKIGHDGKSQSFDIKPERDTNELLIRIQTEVPWLDRMEPDKWFDSRQGLILTTSDMLARYADLPFIRKRLSNQEHDWFENLRKRVNLHVIEAQRLLRITPSDSRRGGSAMVLTVRDYAQDLQRKITETLANYASKSQALDQSFPQRLLRAYVAPLSIDDIKNKMLLLEEKRKQLKSIGLLDDNAGYPFDASSLDNLDTTRQSVMALYIKDTEDKLSVFDDLARRVEILRDNVNDKFIHKSIKIDRERGFEAIGYNQMALDLDALSSGEQHELVLLYDLLFKVIPNTLVLIDEPELSLHIGWQKRFLNDLLEIVKTANFDALVATHSVFIAGERPELMVELNAEIA